MANIPRFTAQITEVSVPRMQDYGYEQNRSIYKTLKQAGERMSNTFFEMLANGELLKKNPDYETNVMRFEGKIADKRSPQEIQSSKKEMSETPIYMIGR